MRAFEPPHDKTNKRTFAPSEDSDQPRHPPSLIRVFVVRSKDSQGSKASSCGQRRLVRLGGSQADRWAHSRFVGFVMRWLICIMYKFDTFPRNYDWRLRHFRFNFLTLQLESSDTHLLRFLQLKIKSVFFITSHKMFVR